MSNQLILGVHVTLSSKVLDDKTTASNMEDAINRDIDALSLNAAQIFTYGPQNMSRNKMNYENVFETCADLDLTVHSAYQTVSVWKITKSNLKSSRSQRSLLDVKDQLRSCKETGAWGLVLHVTKQTPEQVAYVMNLLKPLSIKTGVKIILEMVSSKADSKTYETPGKINYVTNLIGAKELWWCWCVDTAHLWGAGVDIRSNISMSKWLKKLKYPKKIGMFHLNGSSAILGSGKDKHEIAFGPDDVIWNSIDMDDSGVKPIVEFAIKNACTIICEINRGLEQDTIKSLNAIKTIAL